MSVFSSESSLSSLPAGEAGLAQLEKCEFTSVNDHFESKRNVDSGLYAQTLIKQKLKEMNIFGLCLLKPEMFL
jgi:hypothetical protein